MSYMNDLTSFDWIKYIWFSSFGWFFYAKKNKNKKIKTIKTGYNSTKGLRVLLKDTAMLGRPVVESPALTNKLLMHKLEIRNLLAPFVFLQLPC